MRLQPSGKAPHFVGQHQGLDKFKTYIQPHNAGIESSNLSRRTNSRNAYFVMTSIVDAYSNFNCTYLLNKNTQKASSPFLNGGIMQIENNRDRGRAGLSLAIAYFGSNGYTVNLPINDTQWYDLVIEKDGKFETVQCKFTGSKENEVNLTSCGGTNGSRYDSVLNHPLDWLFCADKDKNLYLIPMEDLRKAGNTKAISLRKAPNSNKQGFNTYTYLVEI